MKILTDKMFGWMKKLSFIPEIDAAPAAPATVAAAKLAAAPDGEEVTADAAVVGTWPLPPPPVAAAATAVAPPPASELSSSSPVVLPPVVDSVEARWTTPVLRRFSRSLRRSRC